MEDKISCYLLKPIFLSFNSNTSFLHIYVMKIISMNKLNKSGDDKYNCGRKLYRRTYRLIIKYEKNYSSSSACDYWSCIDNSLFIKKFRFLDIFVFIKNLYNNIGSSNFIIVQFPSFISFYLYVKESCNEF
ncbi:hypothetical protein MKS88_005210 [Plasmodium brasilianum]|uniref:Uncharacterized protein n=1 Tax=Plasmodium brasilianum TaxID=5824 RepID=A0ACB9Y616_PLABR|nr:hypothetical protein MKS88_005210 [Plasmodium brasilianum]